MSGMAVSKMTLQGLFWVRLRGRSSEGVLSMISHSIKCVDLVLICLIHRADIDHNTVELITDRRLASSVVPASQRTITGTEHKSLSSYHLLM